jgi:tight adherence protein C
MGIAILAFLAVFLLIASAGILLFYREVMLRRISEAITPHPKEKRLSSAMEKAKASLGGLMGTVETLIPRTEKEVSVLVQRLTRAGYRNDTAVKVFRGVKVVVPLVLVLLVLVTGLAGYFNPFFVYLIALGGGYLAPDFVLGSMIDKRQKKITRGLPDVLDLLVICMEAGLSLDQATSRTAEELTMSQPEICDELTVVVLEQRAGRPRSEAWKHMSDRTGVESLSNLVSMMVQTEQFGTSIAKMLRVHSETLRTQRVQAVEEMAAKTTVKLVFPLVLFIFPALFVVTLGPAAIVMIESFTAVNR